MTAFKFANIDANTNMVRNANGKHIGWVDGFKNGQKCPINQPSAALRVRFRDGVTDVDPQSIVDCYNDTYDFETAKALAG